MADSIHAYEHPLPVSVIQTPMGKRHVPRSDIPRDSAKTSINTIQAQGSLSGLIQNGSSIDFYLQNLGVDVIDPSGTIIQLQITNGGASAATFIPAYLWFQSIQVMINGGQVLYTIYPENMMTDLMYLDAEKTQMVADMQNWVPGTYSSEILAPAVAPSASRPTGVTLAAGASRTFYIPLSTILDQTQFPISCSTPWRFRCFFATDILATTSALAATTLLQVTQAQMFVIGKEYSSQAKQVLVNQIKSGVHAFSGYVSEEQTILISSGAVSANTTTNQTLSNCNGRYSQIHCFLRQASAANELRNQQNYTTSAVPSLYACDQITLYDSAGVPYYNVNLDNKLLKFATGLSKFDSNFYNVFEVYTFCFGESPQDSHDEGARGDVYVNNQWHVQLRNLNALASGCELCVVGQKLVVIELSPSGSVEARYP